MLIIKGGNTKEIINFIHVCKTKRGFLVGVTEDENSILVKEANLFLKIKVEKRTLPISFTNYSKLNSCYCDF